MPKYLGKGQLGECQRSGAKCFASELIRDGRNPHLLVLPEWYDPPHPQERPFAAYDAEGTPRYEVAPDHGEDVAPVLSALVVTDAAVMVAGLDPAFSVSLVGFNDAVETEGAPLGSLTPQTGFGAAALIAFEFNLSLERFTVGLDSGVENAPPAVDALIDITFRDDVEVVTLRAQDADSTFVGAVDTEFSSRRYWRFEGYPTARLTTATTYTLQARRRVDLDWAAAETIGPRLESYQLYRASGSGSFSLLTQLPIVFGGAPDYDVTATLEHSDFTSEADVTYSYRVDATADDARALASNVVQIDFDPIVPVSPVPSVPPVLTANTIEFAVSMSWTAATGPLTLDSYQVERNLNSAGFVLFATVDDTEPRTSSDTLSAGDTAQYRVRAMYPGPIAGTYSNVETESPSDPFFANVVLLLHMNGANGGTTFTDNSPTPKTMTANGGAVTSTAQVKFGSAAFHAPSAGSVSTPDAAAFDFSTGDWTIEAWVYKTEFGGNLRIVEKQNFSTLFAYDMLVSGSTVTASGNRAGDGNAAYLLTGTISFNAWTHVALTRSGDVMRLFVGGVLASSVTLAVGFTTLADNAGALFVGSSPAAPTLGYLDDLRMTKGVARYTANFTPPAQQFLDG